MRGAKELNPRNKTMMLKDKVMDIIIRIRPSIELDEGSVFGSPDPTVGLSGPTVSHSLSTPFVLSFTLIDLDGEDETKSGGYCGNKVLLILQ